MLAESNAALRVTTVTRPTQEHEASRILTIVLARRPQALVNLAQLLVHRQVNVVSMMMTTEQDDYHTVSAEIDVQRPDEFDRIVKFLNRCVDVIKVVALDTETAHHRQAVLVKVMTNPQTRGQVVDVARAFTAEIVDVSVVTMTLFCAAHPRKIRQLLKVLEPLSIKEVSGSGVLAMLRGQRAVEIRARRDIVGARWADHAARSDLNRRPG
jgi:acetolactate synthase-1/3 small subunit